MHKQQATQFSIEVRTKNRLDRFKAENKERIIQKYRLPTRMVTNTHVINLLLDTVGAKK